MGSVLIAEEAHRKCETIWLSHKSLGLFITGVFVVPVFRLEPSHWSSGFWGYMWKAYEIILKTDICILGTEISLDVDAVFHISYWCWLKIWKLKLFLQFWASILRLILDVNFTPEKVWIKTCCTGKHENVGPRCLMKLTATGYWNLQRSSPNGSGWGFIPGHTFTNWVS